MKTYTDGAYKTFKEETTDALLDKEFFLVALGTAEGTVKLATSIDDAIGVLESKREGDPHVNVRLLGKGGTVKVKAGGVIAKGARVKWGTGGKVVTIGTTPGTFRTIGVKLTQGSSADGDVIEIDDIVERSNVASSDSLTALTFSATVTQAEAQAFRNAVLAALQAQGLMA